jgi:hypothetical protein
MALTLTDIYNKLTWKNSPDHTTPINDTNLNHIETGIKNNNTGLRAAEQAINQNTSDIASINADLTDNGKTFKFGYDSATDKMGYYKKVGGADTFFPFSNMDDIYDAIVAEGETPPDKKPETLAKYISHLTLVITNKQLVYSGGAVGTFTIKFSDYDPDKYFDFVLDTWSNAKSQNYRFTISDDVTYTYEEYSVDGNTHYVYHVTSYGDNSTATFQRTANLWSSGCNFTASFYGT